MTDTVDTIQLSKFTIQPSFESSVGMFVMVIFLYVCYLSFIGYMASYDIAYVPNFVMFINFIFDNYDGQKSFENYIKTMSNESFVGQRAEGLQQPTAPSFGGKEGFEESDSSFSINAPRKATDGEATVFMTKWKNQFFSWYNRLLLMFYTKGKKIKVYRT